MTTAFDQKTLNSLLKYDPETGKLFWKERTCSFYQGQVKSPEIACLKFNNNNAGKEALTTIEAYGYPGGRILGKYLKAHRVIFCMHYGYWPKEVDHINGIAWDNRLENLRESDRKLNQKNLKRPINNTTGRIGVSKHGSGYRAYIWKNEKQIHIGVFDSLEQASKARLQAEQKLGYHVEHGRVMERPDIHTTRV